MGRTGRERATGSARVFVGPVAMLVVGLAAGLFMWRILMADTGRGAVGAAAGSASPLAEAGRSVVGAR